MTVKKGFTIVELLIVIVVIGILAAITIVAYNGIQTRAKSTAEQTLASQIMKKAESFNSIESSYPSNVAGFGTGAGTAGNPAEGKLDDATQVVDWTSSNVSLAATYASGSQNRVVYRPRTGGACIFWWDYGVPGQKVITAGAAVATGSTAGTGCVATS